MASVSFCRRFMMRAGLRRHYSGWLNLRSPRTSGENISVDVEKLFFDERVQQLLKNSTGVSYEIVFQPKPQSEQTRPFYRLVTNEEFQELEQEATSAASQRLQMPPMIKSRSAREEVISVDTELSGLETSKLVFTDISFDVSQRDRVVVVREPEGVLRNGTWDEQNRMNRTYFPKKGQRLEHPAVFYEPNLKYALEDGKHVFVLDWACLQFEPDDPDFIRIMKTAFDHMDSTGNFDIVWSSRYFGCMVFYLALNQRLDNIMIYLSHSERIAEMANLVRLFALCHPDSETARNSAEIELDLELVKIFAQSDAKDAKATLELFYQSQRQKQAQPDKIKLSSAV